MNKYQQIRKMCGWLGISLLVGANPSQAENIVLGGLTYAIDNATQTASVLSYNGSSDVVTIPSEVSGCMITSIADNAFYNNNTLSSIVIPSSVVRIGRSAFAYSQKLRSVHIPASVAEIGFHAFNGCSQLTQLEVDANNPSYSAESAVLFNKDRTLLIAANGISGSYIVPQTVKEIADYAFEQCEDMSSVILPDSLTTIGDAAFYDCLSVTNLTIPASVTSIASDVLAGCAKLKNITVDGGNTQYSSDGQALYNKDYSCLIGACRRLSGHYALPATVTAIGDGAFYGCRYLTSVSLPAGLRSIGYYAFAYSALQGIDLPNTLDSLSLGAFQYCNDMRYANLTGGNILFGPQIFTRSTRVACTNACSVRLKDSQTEIAENYSGNVGNYVGGNWYGTDLLRLTTGDAQQAKALVNDSTSVLSQMYALRAKSLQYIDEQKAYYEQMPKAVRQQIEKGLASSDNFGVYATMNDTELADSLASLKQTYKTLQVELEKVKYSRPDWQVDPRLYEYNMNFIGRLSFDDRVADDSNSMLAAFDVQGNCIGVATPQYNAQENSFFTMLTVYGNAQSLNNALTFKAWDSTTHRVYEFIDAPKFQMKANDVNGTLHEPVVFNGLRYPDMQKFYLHEGWQWLSFNTLPEDCSVGVVLDTLISHSVMFKSQSAFAVPDSLAANWQGSLDSISANEMYKLNMVTDEKWVLRGNNMSIADVKCNLVPGWNWIAYIPQYSATPDYALAAANPVNGDVLKSQNGFVVYDNGSWFGNLGMMLPGEGYMYKRANQVSTSFNYPTDAPSAFTIQSERAACVDESANAFPLVDRHVYPDNMTIIACVEIDGQPVTDAEIAAYVDGECRGTAKAYGDSYFLTVSGQGTDQPLTLRVAHNGQMYDVNAPFSYADNAMVGTLERPYVLAVPCVKTAVNTSLESDAAINVMPRRVATYVTISTNGIALRSVAVYNSQGQLCYTNHAPSTPMQIAMATMPSGVYVIKVVTADGRKHSVCVIK